MKKNFRLGFVVAAVMVVFILILGSSALSVSAQENKPVFERHFESIVVEEGDSLWSYANTYAADLDMTVSEYISTVKEMNHMSSDRLIQGNHIILVWAVAPQTAG